MQCILCRILNFWLTKDKKWIFSEIQNTTRRQDIFREVFFSVVDFWGSGLWETMFYYDALVVRVDELHELLLCGANLIYLASQFTVVHCCCARCIACISQRHIMWLCTVMYIGEAMCSFRRGMHYCISHTGGGNINFCSARVRWACRSQSKGGYWKPMIGGLQHFFVILYLSKILKGTGEWNWFFSHEWATLITMVSIFLSFSENVSEQQTSENLHQKTNCALNCFLLHHFFHFSVWKLQGKFQNWFMRVTTFEN